MRQIETRLARLEATAPQSTEPTIIHTYLIDAAREGGVGEKRLHAVQKVGVYRVVRENETEAGLLARADALDRSLKRIGKIQ